MPSRPIGVPVSYKGAYWMRSGESLVPMTHDQLRRILDEAGPDFSAETCKGASVADLDPAAIADFRARWHRRSGNHDLQRCSDEQLLADAELIVGGKLTFAALILLGARAALGRHLAQSELIFEYRSSDASIEYQRRQEFRQGFLSFHDELWRLVGTWNQVEHFQDGFFAWDIPTFREEVVREAVLNAVCHRDYRHGGSVFVRQLPKRIEIVSPGGFPPGITAENLLWNQNPRNRRLAEALARCGLVERSGQGADRMFRSTIRDGKLPPDYSRSDAHQVSLTLHGEIRDTSFLRFLEAVAKEKQASFAVDDLLVLERVSRGERLPEVLRDRVPDLVTTGVLERAGRGKLLLSERYYSFTGRKGQYTRARGLDALKKKALIVQHLDHFGRATTRELEDVLPEMSRRSLQRLLHDLTAEGRIERTGAKRGASWAACAKERPLAQTGAKPLAHMPVRTRKH